MRKDVRNVTLLIALVGVIVALGIRGLGVSQPDDTDPRSTDSTRGDEALGKREVADALETPTLEGDADITVIVRDAAGSPLAAATVEGFPNPKTAGRKRAETQARILADPVPAIREETDAEGRVRFDGLAPGSWTFCAHRDGYARAGQTRTLGASEEAPDLILHLGESNRLTGRVLDSNGKLLAGALVLAARPGSGQSLAAAPLSARARTGEDGSFALSRLASGDHALLVAIGGSSPIPVITVRIPALTEIDLVLRLGGVLTGAVTDESTKKPIEGAVVNVTHWGPGGSATTHATTDAQGHYRFDPLPFAAVGMMTAEAEGYMSPLRGYSMGLSVPAGKTVKHDLALVPGSPLSGRITGPEGPVANARITVHHVRPGSGWATRKTAVSDAGGRYAVTGLPSGLAAVQVYASGLYQAESPPLWDEVLKVPEKGAPYLVEILEDGTAVLDVTMARGPTVEGKVLTPDGAAVAGATVSCSGGSSQVTSGSDGAFSLTGVAPNPSVVLRAYKTGYVYEAGKPITVPADQPVRDAEIRLKPAAVVRGRLTSADGRPLRDVRVSTQSTRQTALRNSASTTSIHQPVDADGRYEATVWKTSGKFVVLATAVGYAPAVSEPVEIVEGQPVYEMDLTLGAGGDVAGRVVANGEPLPGAIISFSIATSSSSRRGRPSGGLPVVAVTDTNGRFRIFTVPEGTVEISVRAHGYADLWHRIDVPQSSEPTLEMKPALDLSGSVAWVDGTPAEGIPLQVVPDGRMRSGFNSWLYRTVSRKDGSFEIANLPEGRYKVTVTSSMSGSRANVQATTSPPFEAGSTDVRLVVERGGIIAGEVVDQDGEPVVMASVSARAKVDKRRYVYGNAQTDGYGRFRLIGLALVPQQVTVSSRGNRGNALRLPVVMKDVAVGTMDLKVVLTEGPTIEGTVKDEDGEVIPNARIGARRVQEGRPSNMGHRGQNETSVDAAGAFRISCLESGPHQLYLTSYDRGMTLRWKLHGGDRVEAGTQGLRLTALRGGIIAGRVTDATGKPLERVWVQVSRRGSSGSVSTGADGTFEIQGLEDTGEYSVSVSKQGWKRTHRSGVTAGTTNLALVLEKGRRVTGRLVDQAGKPLAGAHLSFSSGEQGRKMARVSARTDERGRFEAVGLDDGTYKVMAWVPVDRRMRRLDLGTIRAGTLDAELRAEK